MELASRTLALLEETLACSERARECWDYEPTTSGWDEPDDIYFGLEGEPISRRVWVTLFGGGNRSVAQQWVLGPDGRRVWISTVWIGYDGNLARGMAEADVDTRPWPYESMVFSSYVGFADVIARRGYQNLDQWKSATWEEAQEQHAELVDEWGFVSSRLS